jgi:hypothetical protein
VWVGLVEHFGLLFQLVHEVWQEQVRQEYSEMGAVEPMSETVFEGKLRNFA